MPPTWSGAIAEAAAGGAAMLFTPEMSGLLDRDRQRARPHLRNEASDPVLAAVREAARRAGIWVHLGSLALRRVAGGRTAGQSRLRDRRRGRDPRPLRQDPSVRRRPADRRELARIGRLCAAASARWWSRRRSARLGLSICYDLRFADLYRALTDAGATILSIPAAFTVPTGEAHWHVLMRARAIEAGVFVVAAAQVGRHEDGRETYGHSLVVDPWGEVLLDMGEEDRASASPRSTSPQVEEVRSRLPAIRHRRPIRRAGAC